MEKEAAGSSGTTDLKQENASNALYVFFVRHMPVETAAAALLYLCAGGQANSELGSAGAPGAESRDGSEERTVHIFSQSSAEAKSTASLHALSRLLRFRAGSLTQKPDARPRDNVVFLGTQWNECLCSLAMHYPGVSFTVYTKPLRRESRGFELKPRNATQQASPCATGSVSENHVSQAVCSTPRSGGVSGSGLGSAVCTGEREASAKECVLTDLSHIAKNVSVFFKSRTGPMSFVETYCAEHGLPIPRGACSHSVTRTLDGYAVDGRVGEAQPLLVGLSNYGRSPGRCAVFFDQCVKLFRGEYSLDAVLEVGRCIIAVQSDMAKQRSEELAYASSVFGLSAAVSEAPDLVEPTHAALAARWPHVHFTAVVARGPLSGTGNALVSCSLHARTPEAVSALHGSWLFCSKARFDETQHTVNFVIEQPRFVLRATPSANA